ncbi:MAG: hypothetical protein GX069_01425 [Tissierellia bacterium]|nr:hypothetical protein [Tissierellia bacterium]
MVFLDSLSDDELLDLVYKQMENLNLLSNSGDGENIRKAKAKLHVLIKEIKRRNIKLDERATARRILKEY